MSRRSNLHLARSGTPEGEPKDTWCEAGRGRWARLVDDPNNRAVCPDCSKAYWRARLAAEPNGYSIPKAGLTEEEREEIGSKWNYRAMFPITGPAGHVGFISLRNGFGKGYAVTPWRVNQLGEHEARATSDLRYAKDMPVGYDGEVVFVCKEQALFHVPKLVASNALQDRVVVEREAAEEREAAKVRREERARQDEENARQREISQAARAEKTKHIQDAFAELLARNDVTNFQREGLILAAVRMGIEVRS